MSGVKRCSPKCRLFRCGKRALVYRENQAWCKWTEDECDVTNCSYAICVRRRLLPGGICGETVKRRTVERGLEEVVGPVVKLKGKALRRLGEREIF